jgi:RimJ/RimL family protein N-acetyltransferase
MDGHDRGMGDRGHSLIVAGPGVVEYVERVNGRKDPYSGYPVGIGIEKEGKLIGGIVFHEFNGSNFYIHVASDHPKRWVTREWLHSVFSYAFDVCKAKRITGIVPESNQVALNFDLSVGFEIEARLKDAHPKGDMLVIKMTRETCKWIDYERFPKPAARS